MRSGSQNILGSFNNSTILTGALLPRLTSAQETAVSSPVASMLIYNTTLSAFRYYNGTAWATLGGGGSGTLQDAYNASTGGGTPEIILDSTRGALTIQDNATPVGNLLDIQNKSGTSVLTTVPEGLRVTAGSVSSPSLSFISDTASGIFSGGTGEVRVAAKSSNVLSVTHTTGVSANYVQIQGTPTGVTPTITTAGTDTAGTGLGLTIVPRVSAGNGAAVNILTQDATSGSFVAGNIVLKTGSNTVGLGAGNINLTAGSNSLTTNSLTGGINLIAGNSTGSGGSAIDGGVINITGGSTASSIGGNITIAAGQANAGATNGGAVIIKGGQSLGTAIGGGITLNAGTSSSGQGGLVSITSGSGSSFGGNMTFTTGGGAVGGNFLVTTGSASGASNGGIVQLTCGNTATSGTGGGFTFTGGSGGTLGTGGGFTLNCGAGGTTSGTGGGFTLTCGASTSGTGGALSLSAGNATTGTGGAVTLQSGLSSNGAGGNLTITARNAGGGGNNNGGILSLAAGLGTGSGNGGSISLSGGNTSTGSSGNCSIIAGSASSSGVGGQAKLQSGNSTSGSGGDVLITAGTGPVSNGQIILNTNSTPSITVKNAAIQFNNYGAGTLQTDVTGNITAVSDEKFKNIIGSFDVGLQEVLNIEPILYRWNEQSGLEQKNIYAGFSAQNVKRVIPVAVNEKDGLLSLSDRSIIAALVNCIKEQQKQIDELKNKYK